MSPPKKKTPSPRTRTLLPSSLRSERLSPSSSFANRSNRSLDHARRRQDKDDANNEEEVRQLSPRDSRDAVSGADDESDSSGLEVLRSALGGFTIDDDDDDEYGTGGDSNGAGSQQLPSVDDAKLDAASAARNNSAAGGGSNRTCLDSMLHCCCPLVRLAAAARRQGPAIFWRLLPSILVTKAFWLSLLTLGLCDLAKVVAVIDGGAAVDGTDGGAEQDSDPVSESEDVNGDGFVTLTFGLWAYSDSPERHGSGDGSSPNADGDDAMLTFLESEEDRLTSCTFHLGHDDGSHVFFMDPIFRAARAFGVLAVGVGGMAMVALWMGLLRGGGGDGSANGGSWTGSVGWKRTIAAGLVLCCAFEGLTLLIFNTGVCGNVRMEERSSASGGGAMIRSYRDCTIAEGSSSPITACVFWLLTGLAMVKLPVEARGADSSDNGGGAMNGRGRPGGFDLDDERISSTGEEGRDGTAAAVAAEQASLASLRKADRRQWWWTRILRPASLWSERGGGRENRVGGYTSDLQMDDDFYETDDDEEGYEGWMENTLQVQMRDMT